MFKPGPVFASVVLADEINRATPKTQSALLEVMDRGKITVDGEAHSVGVPFMVVAHAESRGTTRAPFPLPESQMDRFLMRLQMGYPQPGDELEILRSSRAGYDAIALNPVVTRSDILKMQTLAGKVFVEDSVLDYILKLITATRTEAEFKSGASVRGGLALRTAAQSRALVQGRDFVVPDDVQAMAGPVLAHRLSLNRQTSDALEERRTVLAALRRIMAAIPVPE
ncbi:MAG: MoxR family ATPase [Lacunisphaera sp.]